MNRLTEWTGERWIARQEKLNGKRIGDKDIYARLAAYENTGLEPEHIDETIEELLIYKDAEQAEQFDIEQGLLIKLPCK